MGDLSIPLKQCSSKENCVHSEAINGGWLPATKQYFRTRNKSRDGLAYECNACRAYKSRQRNSANPSSWTLLIKQQGVLREQGLKLCTKCRQVKPLTIKYFQVDKSRVDGHFNYCKACSNARMRELRPAHTERNSRTNRLWREAHPDYPARWRQNNPASIAHTNRKWRQNHPEIVVEKSAKRRARKKSQYGTFTAKDWQVALEYWNYRCAVCGRTADLWTTLAQDHWYPLSKGGAHDIINIVPLCHAKLGSGVPTCNLSKRDREPLEWLVAKFGAREANAIASRVTTYFQWLNTPRPT